MDQNFFSSSYSDQSFDGKKRRTSSRSRIPKNFDALSLGSVLEQLDQISDHQDSSDKPIQKPAQQNLSQKHSQEFVPEEKFVSEEKTRRKNRTAGFRQRQNFRLQDSSELKKPLDSEKNSAEQKRKMLFPSERKRRSVFKEELEETSSFDDSRSGKNIDDQKNVKNQENEKKSKNRVDIENNANIENTPNKEKRFYFPSESEHSLTQFSLDNFFFGAENQNIASVLRWAVSGISSQTGTSVPLSVFLDGAPLVLCGPTGSGKTHLVRAIFDLYCSGVPLSAFKIVHSLPEISNSDFLANLPSPLPDKNIEKTEQNVSSSVVQHWDSFPLFRTVLSENPQFENLPIKNSPINVPTKEKPLINVQQTNIGGLSNNSGKNGDNRFTDLSQKTTEFFPRKISLDEQQNQGEYAVRINRDNRTIPAIQQNQREQTSQISQISQIKQLSQSNQTNQLSQIDQTGQLNQTIQTNTIQTSREGRRYRLPAVYLTGNDFFRQLIWAIEEQQTDLFRQRFSDAFLIVIDGLETFASRPTAQTELLTVLSRAQKKNSLVLLTSSLVPSEIRGLSPALTSRLAEGMLLNLVCPAENTRRKILRIWLQNQNILLTKNQENRQKKQFEQSQQSDQSKQIEQKEQENQIALSRRKEKKKQTGQNKQNRQKEQKEQNNLTAEELLECLVDLLPIPYAAMSGAFQQLSYQSEWSKEPLSREKIAELLNQRRPVPDLTLELIAKKTGRFFSVPLGDLRSKSRLSGVVFARNVAIYLARTLTDLTLVEIGHYFARRDHKAISHAVHTVEEKLKSNTELRENLEKIKQNLIE